MRVHDLRDWGMGRHRTVDDTTYGGGAGMVLRPEPVAAALAASAAGHADHPARPGGRSVRQSRAAELAGREHLVLVCARYEGVDERIRSMVDLELSIGDYVLTGGELAALVVIDSVIRLLPGAIDDASTAEESFTHGLLEYPQYTRPPSFDGEEVPPILSRATTAPCAAGASRSRCAERWSADPTSLSIGRRAPRSGTCSTSSPMRRTGPPVATRTRAILRRRSRSRDLFPTPTRSLGCPRQSGTAT